MSLGFVTEGLSTAQATKSSLARWGSALSVSTLSLRVYGSGFGSGFIGFRVQGLGFMV